MLAINRRVVESVPSGKVRLHLTSPEGTDLWLDNDYSGELEELRDGGVPPYSLQILGAADADRCFFMSWDDRTTAAVVVTPPCGMCRWDAGRAV